MAGINRGVAQQNGARAAARAVATFLRAGEAGIIPQRVEERDARFKEKLNFFTVDGERHGNGVRADDFFAVDLVEFRRDGLDLRRGRRGRDGAEALEERAPRVRAKIFRFGIFHATQWEPVSRL